MREKLMGLVTQWENGNKQHVVDEAFKLNPSELVMLGILMCLYCTSSPQELVVLMENDVSTTKARS